MTQRDLTDYDEEVSIDETRLLNKPAGQKSVNIDLSNGATLAYVFQFQHEPRSGVRDVSLSVHLLTDEVPIGGGVAHRSVTMGVDLPDDVRSDDELRKYARDRVLEDFQTLSERV